MQYKHIEQKNIQCSDC